TPLLRATGRRKHRGPAQLHPGDGAQPSLEGTSNAPTRVGAPATACRGEVVTDHGDRLRGAFESRESETPDPSEVYARVVELSSKHKWRRRGMTVAGGTALGAGLIA